ncbi:hypothetical protein KC980_04300, partial [candidate division WWE3 bacterium]|nr:hypothetical protein [candidate division WWE3 bacterium]
MFKQLWQRAQPEHNEEQLMETVIARTQQYVDNHPDTVQKLAEIADKIKTEHPQYPEACCDLAVQYAQRHPELNLQIKAGHMKQGNKQISHGWLYDLEEQVNIDITVGQFERFKGVEIMVFTNDELRDLGYTYSERETQSMLKHI